MIRAEGKTNVLRIVSVCMCLFASCDDPPDTTEVHQDLLLDDSASDDSFLDTGADFREDNDYEISDAETSDEFDDRGSEIAETDVGPDPGRGRASGVVSGGGMTSSSGYRCTLVVGGSPIATAQSASYRVELGVATQTRP